MSRQRGFTLIELIITVAIVALLAKVAYPAYTKYVARANRSAAVSLVMSLASRQEQYNLDARQYASSLSDLGAAVIPAEVARFYTITLAADNTAAPPTYTITATPTGSQATLDAQCGTLSINQTGAKTVSGAGPVGSCW